MGAMWLMVMCDVTYGYEVRWHNRGWQDPPSLSKIIIIKKTPFFCFHIPMGCIEFLSNDLI